MSWFCTPLYVVFSTAVSMCLRTRKPSISALVVVHECLETDYIKTFENRDEFYERGCGL